MGSNSEVTGHESNLGAVMDLLSHIVTSIFISSGKKANFMLNITGKRIANKMATNALL